MADKRDPEITGSYKSYKLWYEVSEFMKTLKQRFTMWYNRNHGRGVALDGPTVQASSRSLRAGVSRLIRQL